MSQPTVAPGGLRPVVASNLSNQTSGPGVQMMEEPYPLGGYIFFAMYISEFLIGTFGNSLVLLVLNLTKLKKSTTTAFMLNLSMADLLVCVFVMPPTSVILCFNDTKWILGRVYCKLYGMLQVVVVFVSIYTMVLMSLDRYLAIVHPISSMNARSYANAVRSALLVWAVTGALTIPLLFIVDVVHGQCIVITSQWMADYGFMAYVEVISVFGYVTPLLVILFLYKSLLKALWTKRGTSSNTASARYEQGKRRTTRLVVIVIVMFTLCVFPYMLLNNLWAWDVAHGLSGSFTFIRFCFFCLYVNNICNPFVYTIQSEAFREHMVNTFPRTRPLLHRIFPPATGGVKREMDDRSKFLNGSSAACSPAPPANTLAYRNKNYGNGIELHPEQTRQQQQQPSLVSRQGSERPLISQDDPTTTQQPQPQDSPETAASSPIMLNVPPSGGGGEMTGSTSTIAVELNHSCL